MKDREGVVFAVVAYLMWGFFPLYFRLLSRSGTLEIISYRILWSLVLALVLTFALRQASDFTLLFRNRRALIMLIIAGFLVTANWGIYVYGVQTGRTLDAALGYFINPLISAGLGVIVNREKLRPMQRLAFAFGVLAVVVLVVAYGKFPAIALGVAFTFGFYGLVKNRIPAEVRPVPGMAMETLATAPLALAWLIHLSLIGQGTGTPTSPYGMLIMAAGPVTLTPLILFAAAAKRVSLTTIGIIQYVSPIMQFLIAWLVIGEPMPPERWAGFILVWIALVIFMVDVVVHQRRATLARRSRS